MTRLIGREAKTPFEELKWKYRSGASVQILSMSRLYPESCCAVKSLFSVESPPFSDAFELVVVFVQPAQAVAAIIWSNLPSSGLLLKLFYARAQLCNELTYEFFSWSHCGMSFKRDSTSKSSAASSFFTVMPDELNCFPEDPVACGPVFSFFG